MAILTVMAQMFDRPGGEKWPPFDIVHRHHRACFFVVVVVCLLACFFFVVHRRCGT